MRVARATLNLYQLVSKHQKANRDEVELEETNEQLNRVSPYPSPHPPPLEPFFLAELMCRNSFALFYSVLRG